MIVRFPRSGILIWPPILVVGIVFYGTIAPANPLVTLETLLDEMIDHEAVARWPQPEYRTCQASSHDRRQKTATDPNGWFANQDYGHALRTQRIHGREEWVILEHEGPGCVTHIWTPNKDGGIIRFYLDGNDQPDIEANFTDLLTGRSLVAPPLGILAVRGANLYLPIPFAKACRVTLSQEPFYYSIQYRTYQPGTAVESFNIDRMTAAAETIQRVGQLLTNQPPRVEGSPVSLAKTIPPGRSVSLTLPAGAASVTNLEVRLSASDIEQALRSTVLELTFDGCPTVWCPIGNFFGVGIAREPFFGWCYDLSSDGTMTCRWIMPYERSAVITLSNLGTQEVDGEVRVVTGDWQWDERSMHFHCNWRQQRRLTSEHADWNYLEARGAGVYVGDTLSTMNPSWNWWGEGDEKIYIDDLSTPAHFGTGLEDYYGYAWGVPNYFQSAFLTAARVRYTPEPIHHVGHTTVSRVRMLDAIPFKSSLRFDMEVSCIGKIDTMAWAVATYWYGRPGASGNPPPMPDEAAQPIPFPPGLTKRHLRESLTQAEIDHLIPGRRRLPGAMECETLMHTTSAGITARHQNLYMYLPHQKLSGGDHLYVDARQVGDYVVLQIPVAETRPQLLTVYATEGPEFGSIRFEVNGRPVDGTHDLHRPKSGTSRPIQLGKFKAVDGMISLRAVVAGKNGNAPHGKLGIGLDCVVVASFSPGGTSNNER